MGGSSIIIQRQTTVTYHLKNKQLLLFVFVRQYYAQTNVASDIRLLKCKHSLSPFQFNKHIKLVKIRRREKKGTWQNLFSHYLLIKLFMISAQNSSILHLKLQLISKNVNFVRFLLFWYPRFFSLHCARLSIRPLDIDNIKKNSYRPVNTSNSNSLIFM